MSRIGKQPIEIPSGVEVSVDGSRVTVTGPRGTLEQTFHAEVRIVVDDGVVRVERPSDDGFHRALHGLTRTLIFNMVEGVTKGYEKRLEIVGVGYRAALKGQDLELAVGFSHTVPVPSPQGIEFEVPAPTRIVIRFGAGTSNSIPSGAGTLTGWENPSASSRSLPFRAARYPTPTISRRFS